MDKHASRRLFLLISMTLLGIAAGFAWGNWYGYDRGKADTMRAIEERLNAPDSEKMTSR